MQKPKVYADSHNADAYGRLRLNCAGTTEDLSRQAIVPRYNVGGEVPISTCEVPACSPW